MIETLADIGHLAASGRPLSLSAVRRRTLELDIGNGPVSVPIVSSRQIMMAVDHVTRGASEVVVQGWGVDASEGIPFPLIGVAGADGYVHLAERMSRPDIRAARGLSYDQIGFRVAYPADQGWQGGALRLVLFLRAGVVTVAMRQPKRQG